MIEYFFGPGDGSRTTWHSAADLDIDGDGVREAVALDFDGDGRADDAMVDIDADGVADMSALDLDDDGVCEAFFGDSGAGLWDRPRAGIGDLSERLPRPSPPPHPTSPHPTPPPRVPLDLDRDGRPEAELVGPAVTGRLGGRLYVDSDGDGAHDQVLVDTDGDGRADLALRPGDPRF